MSESLIIPEYEKLIMPEGFQSFVKDIGPLACDRYALTMTYAAWKLGFVDERITTSNVFCRSLLNNGDTYKDAADEIRNVKIPYLVNAGLGQVAEWYEGWKWKEHHLRYLAQEQIDDGEGKSIRLFPNEFLYWLSQQRLAMDIKAMPEGQLIFPQEPAMQKKGLWWQQMMTEAMDLSLISSSTNLTTVASQVKLAAQREAHQAGATLIEASAKDFASLAEMSLRRSPSIGGLQSARAGNIAGMDNTSNDYAGMCYGISVMGTFAHAWVMLHDTEEEAFENWAKVFPSATVFLVDTYDTLEGVKKAIAICKKYDLDLKGIRLDSGNLGWLSREARILLDEAGFKNTRILATDSISVRAAASLFGHVATEVADRESFVTGFGLGSEIAVNRNNPLLDFVQKLAARHTDVSTGRDELVRELIKLSETEAKTTWPGEIDAIRYVDRNSRWAGDTLIPANLDIGEGRLSRDVYSEHLTTGKVKVFPKGAPFVRLLQPWMLKGEMLQKPYIDRDAPAILAAGREVCRDAMSRLDRDHLHLPPDMPHGYGVGAAEELVQNRRVAVSHIRARQDLQKQRNRFDLAA